MDLNITYYIHLSRHAPQRLQPEGARPQRPQEDCHRHPRRAAGHPRHCDRSQNHRQKWKSAIDYRADLCGRQEHPGRGS